MDLRKAACYRLKEDCGLDYEPTQIVVASGAKHSVYIALMTLCNPGDEVVIAAPYWVSYSEMVKQAGAIPVIVAATEEAHFKITAEQLDAAITDKTKVFMLNSPSNPTGMVYTKAELEAIAEVCCRHNIYVIADEIYCNLVYDNNEFVSFASLGEDVKERTILVNGVSKSYAMTGWRIGYSASNPQLAKVMANYLSHSTSAPSTISQQAAITALTGPQEDMQVMKQAFEQRRDHLVERMNQIEGVSCIKPEGAFYVMMNMKASSARPCTVRSSRAPRTSRSCSLRRVWLRPFRAPHLPRRASSAGAMRPRSPRLTRASTASRRLSKTRKHS